MANSIEKEWFAIKFPIILFLALVILLSILNAIVFKEIPERERREEVAAVKTYSHKIDHIRFESTDNRDLKIFDSILDGKRIVVLGESTHQDGMTFQAKGRLIRYFHEKLGFNVVLYEAGRYDCWLMNNAMSSGIRNEPNDSIAGLGLYDFWWNNDENRPLIHYYIKSKSTQLPIELGGFDIQFSGSSLNGEKRAALLTAFLSENKIYTSDYPTLYKHMDNLNFLGYGWYVSKQLDAVGRKQLVAELAYLEKTIGALKRSEESIIFSKYIADIRNNLIKSWNYQTGSMPSMNMRDSLMAKNLIDQLDSVYPHQKIIIWCANIHAFSNRYDKEYLPLGAHIKSKYGDSSYMIAFSSFGRYNMQNGIRDKPNRYAIENVFHELDEPYFFIDLSTLPEQSVLKGEFVSTINQGINETRRWSSFFDGIFYIAINKHPTYSN